MAPLGDIMIVEPDPSQRTLLTQLLAPSYTLHIADSGQAALDLFNKIAGPLSSLKLACMVLECNLPDIPADKLILEMEKISWADIPNIVVVTTTDTSDAVIRSLTDLHAFSHIVKPYLPDTLKATINAAIEANLFPQKWESYYQGIVVEMAIMDRNELVTDDLRRHLDQIPTDQWIRIQEIQLPTGAGKWMRIQEFIHVLETDIGEKMPDMPNPAVLIVEDDTDYLATLKILMADEPFNVTYATSGQTALETLASHHFDVVVLDINLGDINGDEILQKINKCQPATPEVVVTTAYFDHPTIINMLRMGARSYLVKPVQYDNLIQKINDAASRAHAMRYLPTMMERLAAAATPYARTQHILANGFDHNR